MYENIWVATVGVVPYSDKADWPADTVGAYTNALAYAHTFDEAVVTINKGLAEWKCAIFQMDPDDVMPLKERMENDLENDVEIEEYMLSEARLMDKDHPFASGEFYTFMSWDMREGDDDEDDEEDED